MSQPIGVLDDGTAFTFAKNPYALKGRIKATKPGSELALQIACKREILHEVFHP